MKQPIMPSNCCVRSCNFKKGTTLHVFPREIERYKLWCKAINREDFLEKDFNSVLKSQRVCSIHFDENTKFPANRNRTNLKCGSIPTLYLSDNIMNFEPNTVSATNENLMCTTNKVSEKGGRINQLINNKIQALDDRVHHGTENENAAYSQRVNINIPIYDNSENSECRNENCIISLTNNIQFNRDVEKIDPEPSYHENLPNEDKNDLEEDLRLWALKNRIAQRSINDLLKILNKHGHVNLPKDARTLMKTPRRI